ncbi:MAG: hypothetical protein ACJASX_002152 [Limisphaerales bacterium]|jgi:hypothetical protein
MQIVCQKDNRRETFSEGDLSSVSTVAHYAGAAISNLVLRAELDSSISISISISISVSRKLMESMSKQLNK